MVGYWKKLAKIIEKELENKKETKEIITEDKILPAECLGAVMCYERVKDYYERAAGYYDTNAATAKDVKLMWENWEKESKCKKEATICFEKIKGFYKKK